MGQAGDKGICRLAVIPVRGTAADSGEQVTQLLFGEHYELLKVSENAKWYYIQNAFDTYEGWIDHRQHTLISAEYYDQLSFSDYKINLELSTTILFQKNNLNILLGSVLPLTTNELFAMEEQLAFNGESKPLSQRMDFDFLNRISKLYLNAPYQWGGRSPFGIDCSGLTQMVFRISGYNLMRDASQQATQGTAVKHLDDYAPGDLAFFSNENGKITHVGILLEEGKIIHASGKVRIDTITSEGILDEDSKTYTHRLTSIRRIYKT